MQGCPLWVLAVSKRFDLREAALGEVATRIDFLSLNYTLIAVMSGWMPMMFMTRVRL